MPSVPYSTFYQEVLPYCMELPPLVADNAIRNACIEWCEKTRYLRMVLPPVPVLPFTATYTIGNGQGLPVDTILTDILEAWVGDFLLIPKTIEELTRIYRYVDWETTQGNPQYIIKMNQSQVQLVPIPVVTTFPLNLVVSYIPSRASATVDAEIFEHFAEYIGYGARWKIYETAGQPFYNPEAAAQMRGMFHTRLWETKIKVMKGMSRASPQVEFQRWV